MSVTEEPGVLSVGDAYRRLHPRECYRVLGGWLRGGLPGASMGADGGRSASRPLPQLDGQDVNVQGLLNSFRWGLDNRIHGATGTVGGTATRPDRPEGRGAVRAHRGGDGGQRRRADSHGGQRRVDASL